MGYNFIFRECAKGQREEIKRTKVKKKKREKEVYWGASRIFSRHIFIADTYIRPIFPPGRPPGKKKQEKKNRKTEWQIRRDTESRARCKFIYRGDENADDGTFITGAFREWVCDERKTKSSVYVNNYRFLDRFSFLFFNNILFDNFGLMYVPVWLPKISEGCCRSVGPSRRAAANFDRKAFASFWFFCRFFSLFFFFSFRCSQIFFFFFFCVYRSMCGIASRDVSLLQFY